MKPIASKEIWFENLRQLSKRWYRQETEINLPDPTLITERVEERGDKIVAYAEIQPLRKLESSRMWEAHWDATAAYELLSKALDRIGWKVVLLEERGQRNRAYVQGPSFGGNVVLLEKENLESRAEQFKQAGLVLEFHWKDAAVLQMAEELYYLYSEKIGNAPSDKWVDDIACHYFVQQILGWPFSPWVIELMGQEKT